MEIRHTQQIMTTPTIDQLNRAVQIAEQIAVLESEMAALLAGQTISTSLVKAAQPGPTIRKKRTMSPEGRARIAAGAKARWAKARSGNVNAEPPAATSPSSAPASKKKGGLTEEGRKRMAAAMKKRWAEAKKAGGSVLTKRP